MRFGRAVFLTLGAFFEPNPARLVMHPVQPSLST